MTMPFERERAILWGREFLEELRDSGCISGESLNYVIDLLGKYPTADHAAAAGAELVWPAVATNQVPFEQQQAIKEAEVLLKEIRRSPDLPAELKRQIPYVLRHWP